eukprot:1107639-Pyramimonas_sp.AAC.1
MTTRGVTIRGRRIGRYGIDRGRRSVDPSPIGPPPSRETRRLSTTRAPILARRAAARPGWIDRG